MSCWRKITILGAGLLLLPFCSNILAQTVTSTTGAINGVVSDSSNAVLPGVTITLSGQAEMGTPTTVSGPNGAFGFAAVPPGDYVLTFELSDFGTVRREGVHVGIGFTATVNATMSPGSVNEAVTVTAAVPAIDVTNSVIATHFDAKQITDLPGSRDINALFAVTPAIAMAKMDVGGSAALNLASYTAYGLNSTTGVNRNEVEGIRVGAANGANDNFFPDYGSFAEVVVNTVANSAVSSAPGTFEQYVAKSGGNQYHSDVYLDFENRAMEATNIDAAQIAAGAAGSPTLSVYDTNRLSKFTDFDVDMGGYVKKDKVWWYGAFRHTLLDQAFPWLTDGITRLEDWVYTGKSTYNLTTNQKIIGYYTYNYSDQPDYFNAGSSQPFQTIDALPHASTPFTVYKVEYNAVLSNSMYFEVRNGAYLSGFNTAAKTTLPRVQDTGANTVAGGNSNTGLTRNRPHFNAALSYVKSGWGISHTIKVGGETMIDHLIAPFNGYGNQCDCLSTLVNGTPSQVQIYLGHNDSKNDLRTVGAYLDDTWQVAPRLTLSLGIRIDRYKPSLPDQSGPSGQQFTATDNFPVFNNWGPRFGVTYSLTKDNKNIIKAHWGQAYVYPGVNFTSAFNPNPSGWSQTFKWTQDIGHLGYWVPADGLGTLLSSTGGTNGTQLDPNIQNTLIRQTTGYYERELAPNFGIRAGFVWNGRRQLYGVLNTNLPLSAFSVPIKLTDPGPDGRLGTADDGGAYTGYNVAPAYVGIPTVNTEQNIEQGESNYYTAEITATKRMTGRWSLLASFAETWNHETRIAGTATYNPNAFINTDNSYLTYKNWQAKASATLELPHGFRVIPTLRYQSGSPFGRTFVQTFNYGNTTVLAEPFDAERTANIALLDARVERRFRLGARYTLSGLVDFYNIFNANGEQTVTVSSGNSWLRPTAITGPRIIRAGIKFFL
jgi:hypothetical protein